MELFDETSIVLPGKTNLPSWWTEQQELWEDEQAHLDEDTA
jgi:hypothetical protein